MARSPTGGQCSLRPMLAPGPRCAQHQLLAFALGCADRRRRLGDLNFQLPVGR